MESPQVTVNITHRTIVEYVDQDGIDGDWSITLYGIPARFYLGKQPPNFTSGDPVRITITKEPSDAQPS